MIVNMIQENNIFKECDYTGAPYVVHNLRAFQKKASGRKMKSLVRQEDNTTPPSAGWLFCIRVVLVTAQTEGGIPKILL